MDIHGSIHLLNIVPIKSCIVHLGGEEDNAYGRKEGGSGHSWGGRRGQVTVVDWDLEKVDKKLGMGTPVSLRSGADR